MATLPDYVSSRGHGEISFEIPARMTGATAYQFVLAAARAPLQRFVDAQLNCVSNGAVHYTALPFLFHYYMDVERVTSIPEVIGYVPYREAGFMVPLLQKREGHLLPELKLWLPYILIDRDCGMVAGREVWGYPKAMGVMTMNPDPAQATHCAAETTIFRTLQPDTRGERATLFETNRVTAARTATNGAASVRRWAACSGARWATLNRRWRAWRARPSMRLPCTRKRRSSISSSFAMPPIHARPVIKRW